ncbi:MAG: hypothetical protein ABI570_05375 [Ilumatobacteraceae bacterium]
MEVSKGRIDRLGESIRTGSLSDDDRLLLAGLRRAWRDAQVQLHSELVEKFLERDFQLESRLKNLGTIREKLNRSNIHLSRIRDIVGLRITVTGSREQQDDVVTEIIDGTRADRFKLVDRRSQPSHGYRAAHIELTRGLVIAEIQVRTELQHQWASLFESLSEVLGRGIRYGELPTTKHLSDIAKSRALASLRELSELSSEIARVEEANLETHGVRARLELQNSVINDLQMGLN